MKEKAKFIEQNINNIDFTPTREQQQSRLDEFQKRTLDPNGIVDYYT